MTATVSSGSTAALLVTRAALERMRVELAELQSGRPRLLEAIKSGFTGGDAADHAAFIEQVSSLTELDERIAELDSRIANAVVTEVASGSGHVTIGSVVTVRFAGEQQTERYVVGGPELAQDDITAVSPDSPMGAALLGAARGDDVSYSAPRGQLVLTVVDC